MFIGRERELAALEKLYNSDKFEFAVIYGRRRVGKTALINNFIGEKNAIYFTGVESNSKQNLENLSSAVMSFSDRSASGTVFSSYQAALEYIFRLSEGERVLFVIDEYPYVARAEKSLASTLQLLIDKYSEKSKLMLILCGSSMSYMTDHVLAYKAPLYGRRTAQIKLEPFTFFEAAKALHCMTDEERAVSYGIVGGTPQYLLQFDDRLSVEDNIKNTFLNTTSFLYEEPHNLLKQEVREPAVYTAVISAVASGASRMSEISGKVGETTNVCSIYLKNLIDLGIIRKETPYGEKNSKRGVYSIDDNMFRFWYRFIPENSSLIARGAQDLVYHRIFPQLPDYMGRVFEEICRQYLWEQLLCNKSAVLFSSLGRWWGTDRNTKKQVEIDIMGEQDKDTALFGECKWTNEKVDSGVLETLVLRSRMFNYKNTILYLFSKNGFTKGCIEASRQYGNVRLITLAEMMRDN